MRDDLRDRLNTEITRKQFLQYMGGALLMLFGLDNFIALLTGSRAMPHLPLHSDSKSSSNGFGARRFGE